MKFGRPCIWTNNIRVGGCGGIYVYKYTYTRTDGTFRASVRRCTSIGKHARRRRRHRHRHFRGRRRGVRRLRNARTLTRRYKFARNTPPRRINRDRAEASAAAASRIARCMYIV